MTNGLENSLYHTYKVKEGNLSKCTPLEPQKQKFWGRPIRGITIVFFGQRTFPSGCRKVCFYSKLEKRIGQKLLRLKRRDNLC